MTPTAELVVSDQLQTIGELEQPADMLAIGEQVKTYAESLKVADQAGYDAASDLLVRVRSARKAIEAHRKERTDPLEKAKKLIIADHKRADEPFAAADRTLAGKTVNFFRAQQEAAAKESERQRQIQERRQAKAVEKAAERGEEAPMIPPAPEPQAFGPEKSVQTQSGTATMRKVRKWEITDEAQIPREYLIPDERKIAAVVKAGVEIPGVRAFDDYVPATRGGDF